MDRPLNLDDHAIAATRPLSEKARKAIVAEGIKASGLAPHVVMDVDLTPTADSTRTAKVGDTLFTPGEGRYGKDALVYVLGVGRKWLTCCPLTNGKRYEHTKMKFDIETGREQTQFTPRRAFGASDWSWHRARSEARDVLNDAGLQITRSHSWRDEDVVALAEWIADRGLPRTRRP